jgi:hypothetical protein
MKRQTDCFQAESSRHFTTQTILQIFRSSRQQNCHKFNFSCPMLLFLWSNSTSVPERSQYYAQLCQLPINSFSPNLPLKCHALPSSTDLLLLHQTLRAQLPLLVLLLVLLPILTTVSSSWHQGEPRAIFAYFFPPHFPTGCRRPTAAAALGNQQDSSPQRFRILN